MIDKIKEYARNLNCKVKESVLMSEYTSFKTGGYAKLFITPDTVEDIAQLYKFCFSLGVKPIIVGNGSNTLVSDNGIDGVVIYIGNSFQHIEYCGGGIIKCGAGVNLAKLCMFALEYELTGMEFAFGIPGSVGGAAFMNAGAYGGEMKDIIMLCNHITPDGERNSLSGDNLEFGYRKSAYGKNNCLITSVVFKLEKGDADAIKYKMDSLLERRKLKQPLDYPSAGSVFKRPEGNFAGTLIQECGLKGKTIGGAQVSEKHAGFIINIGNATTKDITDLIDFVQATVQKEKNVLLEKELRVIE
ncbi:MAG: UDP-N-acetylmuramate dehydrogenase [Oscillospiraceae bacterium]